jgi:hypothetical protein
MSDETKLKLSIAHTGKKYSTERVAQMKITFGGKNNPMYGKKMSDESKEKMKKSLTGRKMSDKAKKNMSKARNLYLMRIKNESNENITT